METNKSTQIEPIKQNPQYYEIKEGGLDFVDFIDKISRQIHVVAGITIAISSYTFFRVINLPPNYQAGFEIFSEAVTIETKVTPSGSQSREDREEITAVNLNEVQLRALKSPALIMSVVKELRPKYPLIDYDSIVSTLELKANQKEPVLEVLYEHSDPEQVKDVLQALEKAYLNYSLEKRQLGLNRGLDFLDQQIPTVEAQLAKLNQELQQLRRKYSFIDPNIQAAQISGRIDGLIAQQIEYKSQLETTQKIAALAKKELGEQSTTATTASEIATSRYNELLENLRQIDYQIAQQSVVFSDRSLEIQTLKEQRQAIVSLIDREITTINQKIDNQINLQEAQARDLNEKITSMQQELQKWSGIIREYENIERKINITSENLNELLTQREVLRLESSQTNTPWKLLTPVGEPKTDARITNYVILGTLLGLLIGVGVALILEMYKNVVYSSNQVQEITNQPILGIIPFDLAHKQLSFQKMTNLILPSKSQAEESEISIYRPGQNSSELLSSSVEAFRFLAANLGLFEANSNLHSLIISSAISQEGKSTIALNLGKIVAAIGRKVLVVNTDLRNTPGFTDQATRTFNPGLSDFLLFNNLNLNQILDKSSLDENLFILDSGNTDVFGDTSRLLSSDKMRDLMEELKQYFDLVIYDVPSIIDYADVTLLANKTDGVVLVTALGKLPVLKLEEAMNQLDISKAPILGVVINKIVSNA